MTEKMSRPQPPRPAMPSAPTWQLELSPAFTEALRSVAPPKPRRRVLPYVVALGVIAVIAGIVFGRNALAAQHGTDAATLEKLPATQTITSQAITVVETPPAPAALLAPAAPSAPSAPSVVETAPAPAEAATCAPDDQAAVPPADVSIPVVDIESLTASTQTAVTQSAPTIASMKLKKAPKKSHRRARW